MMIRFRENNFGVTADIRKAFQMVAIEESERNYLRFLWWEKESDRELIAYRHKRLVFGLNCSPFVLNAVIEYHLQSIRGPLVQWAKILAQSFYMDNCITSLETKQEVQEFQKAAIEIMDRAKMDLREWEYSLEENPEKGTCTKILGVVWNKMEDSLKCELPDNLSLQPKLTKRLVLSMVQRIFDPLGFCAPVFLPPKLLLQRSWGLKLGWDTPLPESMAQEFRTWLDQIKFIELIKIPRYMWNDLIFPTEVHIFCDASQIGYGAVAYLRSETGRENTLTLIWSKVRLAPMKSITIPRLELMAMVLGARLANAIQAALKRKCETTLWSDSTTALSWIKKEIEWRVFVRNRVREIQATTNLNDWRFVPSQLNPADLLSRGCPPSQFVQSRWWEGPEWLKKPKEFWPNSEFSINPKEIKVEENIMKTNINLNIDYKDWLLTRRSNYSLNIRVMSYVLRFLGKLKKQSTETGPLKVSELDLAEKKLIRMIQEKVSIEKSNATKSFKILKNTDGLWCVESKLLHGQVPEEFKTPIILPGDHPFVEQLIWEVHLKNGHVGVQFILSKLREKFWIIRGRKTIRKIISKCIACKRLKEKSLQRPMAALPENRIGLGKPFQITGVDLLGPLHLKEGGKVWVAAFTCAVYRAIHLELVKSLETGVFMMALHRFICRRGRPEKIYSDNGTNFAKLNRIFKRLDWTRIERETSIKRIQWIFIPPSAPWWGGFWERMVRTIKEMLIKMLGHRKLKYVQLQTALCEIESIINNRPLTYVSEDDNDLKPLTPNEFLQNGPESSFPEFENLKPEMLHTRYRELGQLKRELKQRFLKEYLGALIQKSENIDRRQLKVGDVVLIGQENLKRMFWPKGRIVNLIPGKDGIVRVAHVKTSTGILIRALQRLHPLEISSNVETIQMDNSNTEPQSDAFLGNRPNIESRDSRNRYGRLEAADQAEQTRLRSIPQAESRGWKGRLEVSHKQSLVDGKDALNIPQAESCGRKERLGNRTSRDQEEAKRATVLPPELTENNYTTWSMKMEAILDSKDLFEDVIVNDEPDFTNNKLEYDIWKKNNREAYSLIILSLSDDLTIIFRGDKRAKRIWYDLKKSFEGSLENKRIDLMLDIARLKLNPNENLGKTVTERELVRYIVEGLTPNFDTITAALSINRGISLPDLRQTLLDFEKKRQDRSKNHENAFRSSGNQFKEKSCYICKRKGHFKKDCWFNPNNKGNQKNTTNKNNMASTRNYHKGPKQNKDTARSAIQERTEEPSQRRDSTSEYALHASTREERPTTQDVWIIDSACTSHMTSHGEWIEHKTEERRSIQVAEEGRHIESASSGLIQATVQGKDKLNNAVTLHNVLHVPHLKGNLMSIPSVVRRGNSVLLNSEGAYIYSSDDKLIRTGNFDGNMYTLNLSRLPEATHVPNEHCLISKDTILGLHGTEGLNSINGTLDLCDACSLGKMTKVPYVHTDSNQESYPFEAIYVDLCGPMRINSLGGSKYFLTIVDGFSRRIEFLKDKLSAAEVLKKFIVKRENELNSKLKRLRTDNGTEFINKNLETSIESKGIKHELTTPYTPRSNGRVERANRTLLDKGRTLLADSQLPHHFWAEAVNTAAYLYNLTSTTNDPDTTPMEKWKGKKSSVSHIMRFGCEVFYKLENHHRHKLEAKSKRGIFVGYSRCRRAYRVFDITARVILVTADIHFRENNNVISEEKQSDNNTDTDTYFFIQEDEQLDNHVLSDVDIEEPAPDTMINRQTESSGSDRPQRTRTIPKRFDDYVLAPSGLFCQWQQQKIQNKVCKLNKSIYSLPQSGRSWYEKFSQVLHDCGLEKLKSDPCLFKWKNEDKYFYVGIYVDDFITVSDSEDTSNRFINKLRHHLEIKDVTCKGMFLGIKIIQDKEGISLQQSHYVQQILQKYGMETCKEVPTPGSKEINLDNHIEDDNCDQHTYQEALGMLMFLAVNTRPDITYNTSKLSQYSRQPKQMHWTAIKRVMRYLRGTIDLGVKFERGKTGILKSYTDASWSTTHDGKSYCGYVLKLGEATIDWKSSKQPLVALSTMEAEMIAACESCCQIKDICLLHKPSQDLEADIFTKDLSRDQMKKHLENLSISWSWMCDGIPALGQQETEAGLDGNYKKVEVDHGRRKNRKGLVIWIEDLTQKRIPLDGHLIKMKALKFYKELKESEPSTSSRESNPQFSASTGWLTGFIKRHSFHNLKIKGEVASADEEAARKYPEKLAKIIKDGGYCAHQIFNADETGLFWKKMPTRTYIAKSEKNASGFKAAKDRVTLLLCSNASGDRMLKPLIVNRSLKPRALKGKDLNTLPVHWMANKKAWVTTAIFTEWFNKCFVPEVENYMKEMGLEFKILLILDNAPGHPNLEHPNIKVVFFPPNTTSLIQPLDQGIISTFKKYYVKFTFQFIFDKLESDTITVTEVWKQFNILNCVDHVALAIAEIKSQTLNACWKAAWPECVSKRNESNRTTIVTSDIISIAKEIGGEGFDDFGLREGLQLSGKLEIFFIQNDNDVERALKFQRDLKFCMSGYRELYKELVKPSQRLITDYLVKEKKITEVPKEALPCRSDDVILSSSDESDLAPIHKRVRTLSDSE
ncbi:hypothetical protein LAZ67_13003275 [Cordylochernes scorpioides]|uniref:Uncharacterized protein n=1 Tax=Cordylochernes scorpioides TaxID=51811 RepID=A0ABY6L593_9ARAC|nr:hypothetical protein LAZ67_13003275 [Cordylochernes scorpioides]